MAGGQIDAQPRRRHHGGDAEPIHPVAHGVAIAIPVADDDRQTDGHRLQGRDPEGLLDVVGQRTEHIGCGPGAAALLWIAAIESDHPHIRADAAGGLLVGLLDGRIGVPATLEQHHVAACFRRSALQRLVQHQRMGLGMEGESPQVQHHQGVLPASEDLAGVGPLAGRDLEIVAVHPQRNHGELRQGEARAAETLAQVGHLAFEQPLHPGAHRLAGADQRIPGLQRRCRELDDGIHRPCGADGVGDAAEAPAVMAEQTALPGLLPQNRSRMEDETGTGQVAQMGAVHDVDRLGPPQPTGQGLEGCTVALVVHLDPQLLPGWGVLQDTTQKRFAGGKAAQDLAAGRRVSLRAIENAGCHPGWPLATTSKQPAAVASKDRPAASGSLPGGVTVSQTAQ
jgi:hypothetical protein